MSRFFFIYFTIIGVKTCIRACPQSFEENIYFQCYVCGVALADKSMKLRILITDMFRFKLQLQKLKVPPEFLFQNGICLRGITWVSKLFVTQSRFAKGSGLLSKNLRQVKMFSFHSYHDLFHEKQEHFKEQLPTLKPFCASMIAVTNTLKVNKYARKGSVVVKKFIAHFCTIKCFSF